MTVLEPQKCVVGQGARTTGVGAFITDTTNPECLVRVVTNGEISRELSRYEKFFRICFQLIREVKIWKGSHHDEEFPLESDKCFRRFSEDQRWHFMQLLHVYREKEVPSDDDECWIQFQARAPKIFKLCGVRKRFWAKLGVSSSMLGAQAAREALEISGLDQEKLDFIIVATTTPDHPATPLTATLILEQLGVKSTGIFATDITAACTSYGAALQYGYALIHSGMYCKGLIVGADVMDRTTASQYHRGVRIMLSSGGFAQVIEACSAAQDSFSPLNFLFGSDPSRANLIEIPAGGSRQLVEPSMIIDPFDQRDMMLMDGQEVMKINKDLLFGQGADIQGAIIDAFKKAGLTAVDIAFVATHQANIRILKPLHNRLRSLGFRGIFWKNIRHFGNMTSASVGLCLYEAWRQGKLKRGDKVMMVVFGGGLTWGIIIFEWTLDSYQAFDVD